MKPSILGNHFNLMTEDMTTLFLDDIIFAFEYETTFSSETREIFRIHDIPIIGGRRLNKIEQAVVMEKLEIPHPKSFFNRRYFKPFRSIEEFDAYVDMPEFVIKPILGARGIGVKKLDRTSYKKCLEHSYNNKTISEVYKDEKEKFIKINPDLSSETIEDSVSSGVIVQEYIKVEREFRLLLFTTGKYLIYERLKQNKQFIGNLSEGSIPKSLSKVDATVLLEPILTNLYQIITKFDYPWLSVDLYQDDEGNLGVFEFQQEFAYEGFNPADVRNNMIASFNKISKKLNNNLHM